MRIRNKILIYFSATVIALSAISLVIVYALFAAHREEEFQQQQNNKIHYTIRLIDEYKQMSEELAHIMDEQDIQDFYDEKLLVYDKEKDLIFSSIDNLAIHQSSTILNSLSPAKQWIETKEGDYDLIGVYAEYNGKTYYAISKAYDEFGYSKKNFLGKVLIGIFIATTIIVLLISFYLSKVISKPITALAEDLNNYDLDKRDDKQLNIVTTTYELSYLVERFNELFKRINESFAFQKHSINHISHELKTPLAIMVSELERSLNKDTLEEVKPILEQQISKAKSLGNTITVLLEISKIESGQAIGMERKRIDELIFDIIADLNMAYSGFNFEINYIPAGIDEEKLVIAVNELLIKHALFNLLMNAVVYADNGKADIKIDCTNADKLSIVISNSGDVLAEDERKHLFTRFFRGANSRNKTGSGLGLVLTKRILKLHSAKISYSSIENNLNIFEVTFPL